ncbi:hypothetical protein FRB96_002568 [Tulasnella sp. 330]|nr:hypothetical protein FRB96_002568 [Tulasnella sp. 330]
MHTIEHLAISPPLTPSAVHPLQHPPPAFSRMVATEPPPYNESNTPQSQRIGVSTVVDAAGKEILITITPPSAPDAGKADVKLKRSPVDFVLTIDISGSMGETANIPGDTEQSGLSVLDIVKHAAKTIITSMHDTDRVAVVTFSTDAKTPLVLTPTNSDGKAKALKVIESLRPEDTTNIWDGLKASLNIFKDLVQTPFSAEHPHRLSSIFLLTDGLPTIAPPRGHIPMLKSYLNTHNLAGRVAINTFGFGYRLDSRLLHSLATLGRGTFGFIADSGMVGTVFVHAVANSYATYADSLSVSIELLGGGNSNANVLGVAGGYECTQNATELTVSMNPLQYGQTRDLIVTTSGKLDASELFTVTVNCRPWDGSEVVSEVQHVSLANIPAQTPVEATNVRYHLYRSKFVATVYDVLETATRSEEAAGYGYQSQNVSVPKGAKGSFESLVRDIEAGFPTSADAPDARALLGDIQGQVLLAVSEKDMFRRWGQHYLLSLARAHQRQTCINFKDVGVQVYGRESSLFNACRDEIDALFDNLPPPKPTVVPPPPHTQGYGGGRAMALTAPLSKASKAGFSMSSYNSKANPCFAGTCSIVLADSTYVNVSDIKPGMEVKTPKGSRKVCGVVKTSIEGGKVEMCEVEKGTCKLLVTPWHPIKLNESENGKWVFPADVAAVRMVECEAVFSIILTPDLDSDAHGVYVGGTLCVTLGHGVVQTDLRDEAIDVRAHPFLGNYSKILHAFRGAPHSTEGSVVHAVGVERSEKTGLVCGFEWK